MSWKGEGNGTPLQYSCLENPMDGGAWQAAVHGVAKSWTRLSNFTFTFHFHALEKEMATHSSVLAWRIPGTGEPGGCHLWGRTESDMTEVTQQQKQQALASHFTSGSTAPMLSVKIALLSESLGSQSAQETLQLEIFYNLSFCFMKSKQAIKNHCVFE